MTTIYRQDIHAAWIESELYKQYLEADSRHKQKIADEIEFFRETVADLATSNQCFFDDHHGLSVSDSLDLEKKRSPHHLAGRSAGSEGSDFCSLSPALTKEDFQNISSDLSCFLRRPLRHFFKEDPDVFIIGEKGTYRYANPQLDPKNDPTMIFVDLDGDGIYQRDIDSVLVRQSVEIEGKDKNIWVDVGDTGYFYGGPGSYISLIKYLSTDENTHLPLEGMTVPGMFMLYRSSRHEPTTLGQIASLIDALPKFDGDDRYELGLTEEWFKKYISGPSNSDREFKDAVFKLLTLAQKGYIDAVTTLLESLSDAQWFVIFKDPTLALRVPQAFRTAALASGYDLKKYYRRAQKQGKDGLQLVLAGAVVLLLSKGDSYTNRVFDSFESILTLAIGDNPSVEPGKLLIAIQGLRDLARSGQLTESQETRLRNLVTWFGKNFHGYKPTIAQDLNSYQQVAKTTSIPISKQEESLKESVAMDLNKMIVFNAFWTLVDLGGRESIRSALHFNEQKNDANWNDREQFYVAYYAHTAADMVVRYLTGDKHGLRVDQDLDIINQWGRMMQRDGDFLNVLYNSGSVSSEDFVEARDGFNRYIAMAWVLSYAEQNNRDWGGLRLDLNTVRDILHHDYKMTPKVETSMMNLTEEDLKRFDQWTDELRYAALVETVFATFGEDWRLKIEDREKIDTLAHGSYQFVNDQTWTNLHNDLNADDLNILRKNLDSLNFHPIRGIVSKNIIVFHILRYAVEHDENWRAYDQGRTDFTSKIEAILSNAYTNDYNKSQMDAVLSEIRETPELFKKFDRMGETYKDQVSFFLLQEGSDQIRLEHFLFDVPVARLMSLEGDLREQRWTWGTHGKLMEIVQENPKELSKTEQLVVLEGLTKSDFNRLLPGWVLQFTGADYDRDVRLKAWEVYRGVHYPQWFIKEALEDRYKTEEDRAVRGVIKRAGRRCIYGSLELPHAGHKPLKVRPGRKQKECTNEIFNKLIDRLDNPSPFRPKEYRQLVRQIMRIFGDHSIDILIALMLHETELGTLPNWPVMGYALDNVFVNFLGTKEQLDFTSFLTSANNEGAQAGTKIFIGALLGAIERDLDPHLFLRTFMEEIKEKNQSGDFRGEIQLADEAIEGIFNERRRGYIIRALRTYGDRALATIGRYMDEINDEIEALDAQMEAGFASDANEDIIVRKQNLEALWNRLYEIQAEVGIESGL